VAIVSAMPAVYAGAHSGFVEVLYAAFVPVAARVGLAAQSRNAYAVCGVFCGLAAATKYTGILAAAAILICVVAAAWKRDAVNRRGLRQGVVFIVVAGSAVAARVSE
jgi:4-amino-4-deoxy-L-arabinose transferase-like glycosyltransferase